MLVNGHGPFAWGTDAMGAAHNAVVMEEVAFMDWHAMMLYPERGPMQQMQLDKHYLRKHGLSYTQFTYSNLTADRDSIQDTEQLKVTVTVKNVGTCAGKTAVQLYVRDVESTVRRPVRELKAFEKVSLQPGESKEITFLLDKQAFAYWESKCHDFFVESGTFVIEIGESSRDIRCEKTVQVEGTTLLSFPVTETTTIGQLLKHPKGKVIIGQMISSSAMSHADHTDSMGEGSERMMQQMMLDIPLGALVSYGRLTPEKLKGLILFLNG